MLKIAFAPEYTLPLPAGHRFPMAKYEVLTEQLLWEGTVNTEHFFVPKSIDEQWILRTHTAAYWTDLKQQTLDPRAARKIGFPLTPELIIRARLIAQGTIDCARHAISTKGCALNIAGGTHHAYADRGEGFCEFNDMAIAANYLLDEGLSKQILIVDLDVHQGNGTAKIFQEEPRVYTFSMHGAKNYPMHKEQSDYDIALPDGADDALFLGYLREVLPRLIETVQPDFVFYLSGVDVLATDKLGRLGMSRAGCRERDKIVFEYCKQYALPVAVSMGGGYSERLTDIVEAHANTFRLAQDIFY